MTFNEGIPTRAAAVTKSDATEIFAVALYVGGVGDVAVITEGGDTVTFTAVPVGGIIPLRISKVLSTGTTATSIVRMW